MGRATTKGGFGQVIAVDRAFELFHRAWCVAEISEANRSHILQQLKVPNLHSIDENHSKIEVLDVRECRASRDEDKDFILEKIEKYTSIDAFNDDLHKLVAGITFRWMHESQLLLREQNEKLKLELERYQQTQPSVAPQPVAPTADIQLEWSACAHFPSLRCGSCGKKQHEASVVDVDVSASERGLNASISETTVQNVMTKVRQP